MKPTDAKHTPGPWKATTSYGAHTDEPWMIWSVPRDRALAQCYRISESGNDNAIEQRANAELIAQAPALLAERDALLAERDRLRAALTELRSYADLKLQGHRQDYDEEHCMVQTALRMIALADEALR